MFDIDVWRLAIFVFGLGEIYLNSNTFLFKDRKIIPTVTCITGIILLVASTKNYHNLSDFGKWWVEINVTGLCVLYIKDFYHRNMVNKL